MKSYRQSKRCGCSACYESGARCQFLDNVRIVTGALITGAIAKAKYYYPESFLSRVPTKDEEMVCVWLRDNMTTSTSHDNKKHEKLLERLWNVSFPDSEDEFCGNSSELWSSIGFQGRDPFTDTRGGGVLSLRCIVWLFENRGDLIRRIKTTQAKRVRACEAKGLTKGGPESFPNYPLACACIHVTRMLCGLFGVSGARGRELAFESHSISFWALILTVGTPTSFYALFCVALDLLDRNYSSKENSNYMVSTACLCNYCFFKMVGVYSYILSYLSIYYVILFQLILAVDVAGSCVVQ